MILFGWLPRPLVIIAKLAWHLCALVGMLMVGLLAFEVVNFNPKKLDPVALALNCDDPCIVKDNPGGSIYLFQLAADKVLAGARKQVIIDGQCRSSCAFFADKARARVCVTPRAVMGFHKGTVGDDERLRITLHHSQDIERWVMRHGGYPSNGMLEMQFAEAKKFWRSCPRM